MANIEIRKLALKNIFIITMRNISHPTRKVNVGRALPADHYSQNLSSVLNETPSLQLAGYNPAFT